MVRPYEEVQEDKVPPEKFKAFASVVCRYIQDTYKQLGWKVITINGSIFRIKGALRYGSIEILGEYRFPKEKNIGVYIRVQDKDHAGNYFGTDDLFGKQTPKDLARAARLVFNWIKEEMKKIPE